MPQLIAAPIIAAVGAGAVGAVVITAGVQIGLGLALSAAANALLRPDLPTLGNQAVTESAPPQDGRVVFTSEVGARTKHYGRVLRAGQVVFARAAGGYIYRIILHGHGEIDTILEIRLDERPRVVQTDGRVLSSPYNFGDLGSLIRIETRKGLVPSIFYAGPAAVAPEWGINHRLDGMWTTYIRAQQREPEFHQTTYPQGPPSVQVLADTTKVLDPRTGSTSYTDNAALVIADWITSAEGLNRPGILDSADLAAAANAAETPRILASGATVDRWRLAGSASMAVAPQGPLQQMLAACGGQMRLKPNGKFGLYVGGDPQPTITLTDDDVLLFERLDDGPDALDRYTELPITYVDETLDYVRTSADNWINEAEETRLGTSIEAAPVNLDWAPSHAQARHAGKIMSARDNPSQQATIKFKPSALPAIYERVVTLNIASLGLTGAWRVDPFTLSPTDLTVTLNLSKIDINTDAWNVTEEGSPQESPPAQALEGDPPPAAGDAQAVGNGTGGNAGIRVAYNGPLSGDVSHYVSYRVNGTTPWTGLAGVNNTSAQISGLVDGQGYDVAIIAARTAIYDPDSDQVTDVILTNVIARDVALTPDAPTGLAVTPGTGSALISVDASASAFGRFTNVFRGATLIRTVRTVPGQEVQFTDVSGAGSFTWTAQAVSVAGQTQTSGGVTETVA